MKVHYLNCGTMHPRFASVFVPHQNKVPCICLLIETGDQLLLADTGFGTRDMQDLSRLGQANFILNVRPDDEQPAIRQIERLGFRPEDVTNIICTHLDRDHAGGLSDFPEAHVHVTAAERDAALNPRDRNERDRYRRCHFAHGPKWITHEDTSGEKWYGLECIRELPGLPPEILLVPLPGHTRGHCGVAVDTGDGWILHCGDAYYVKHELKKAPVDIRGFRRVAHVNHSKAMNSIERVNSALKNGNGAVTAIAAHDKYVYKNLFGKPLD